MKVFIRSLDPDLIVNKFHVILTELSKLFPDARIYLKRDTAGRMVLTMELSDEDPKKAYRACIAVRNVVKSPIRCRKRSRKSK